MDIKSRVITKIDDLSSEYTEEKDAGTLPPDKYERHKEIQGALSALKFLRGQIQGLNPDGFETMGIVERSKSEIPTLRNPKGYLSRVLFSIEDAREHIRLNLRIGDGPHPDAKRGRNEACDLMDEFVWQLNEEIIANQ